MLFPQDTNDRIEDQWKQLLDVRSEGNSFWRAEWEEPAAGFEAAYGVAREKECPETWRTVAVAGRRLREAMRSVGDDDHYLPRYYTRLIAFTDTVDDALEAARQDVANYIPPERDELIQRIERLEAMVERELRLPAGRDKSLRDRLGGARGELAKSKHALHVEQFNVTNNIINVDPASVIGLIRDALEALKHGVDLLNDRRFTEPLRRQALAAWLSGKRFGRAIRQRIAAFRLPWRGGAVHEEFERREPHFHLEEQPPEVRILRILCEPEMVEVPAGQFVMGSLEDEAGRSTAERPQRVVTIRRPFAVGRYAVTFEEWDEAAEDGCCGGYKPDDRGWGRGRRPVINVSWDDAQAYVKWLREKTDKEYRLLTEAEWEYAARAGTSARFWWGSTISTEQANYNRTKEMTVPVDEFGPNPWGLYQMHGNVWEWVEDAWNDCYRGGPVDGSAWRTGNRSLRVVRGGSWDNGPQNLRAAARITYLSYYRSDGLGFRVARTL
jgi:formylglycine-generating enzyme required for sulfatase activity